MQDSNLCFAKIRRDKLYNIENILGRPKMCTYSLVCQAAHGHLLVEKLHDGLLRGAEWNISDVDSASLTSNRRIDGHSHGNITTTSEFAARRRLHERVDGCWN